MIYINFMERRVSDSQKKYSQIKLPVINHRKGESSRVLSNTTSDSCKLRPSSMRKVEDLQKNLFEKLDSYQHPQRKNLKRGTKKKIEGGNSVEPHLQGFQRIQKLMPGLFTKLVEAKKSVTLQQTVQKQAETVAYESKIGNKISTADDKNRKEQAKPASIQKQHIQLSNINSQLEMSQQEFDELYRDYSRRYQMGPPETSGEQLANMGQGLLICQKEIEKLTKSMEGLIRQLEYQCIIDYQEEQESSSG